MVGAEEGTAKEVLILRSAHPRASRRMTASELASSFETRLSALLTLRV